MSSKHLEPVQLFDEFWERQYEVRRAIRFLRQKQNISVVAAAKMGKTSMLNVLSHQDTLLRFSLNVAEFCFVRLEGSTFQDKTQEQCLHHICEAIRQALPVVSAPQQAVRFADLQNACRQTTQAGKILILAFDQFERLTNNTRLDVDFFNGLRALSSAEVATFLIASESSLYDLQQGHIDRLSGSPFFNVFQPIDLKPLEKGSCRDILQRLLPAELSVVFDMILLWANGRPYYLKFAAYHATIIYNNDCHGDPNQWDEARTRKLRKKMAELAD